MLNPAAAQLPLASSAPAVASSAGALRGVRCTSAPLSGVGQSAHLARAPGQRAPITCSAASAPPMAPAAPAPAGAGAPPSEFSDEDYRNFVAGYKSQTVEHDFWLDESMVEGTIPKELEGTLLRNGPGLFEIGGKPIPQPLDGDGMVCQWAFRGGRAHFRNRYVRTAALVAEQKAGRMLFRGAFSVGNPSGGWFFNPFDFSVKGIANTGVLHWGGRTLALYERDLPYALDKELRTQGQTDLGGAVDTAKRYFGAHYRVMPPAPGSGGERRLVGFNASEEGQNALLNFWEFDEQFKVMGRVTHELKGAAFGFFHDLAVTEHYYVMVENPIRLDLWKLLTKYMLARACLAECLAFDGKRNARVWLIPRSGCQNPHGITEPRGFETSPFFAFHHLNAFEAPASAGSTKVVLDTCAMPAGINFGLSFDNSGAEVFRQPQGAARLTRLVLDLATGQVERVPLLMKRSAELPSVAAGAVGRPYRHMFLAASHVVDDTNWGPQQDLIRVDLEPEAGVSAPAPAPNSVPVDTYSPGRDSFAQEPIFVPRPGARGEGEGWLLAMVYRAASNRSDLVILDAQDLAAGPLATLHLPHHIPLGIHGSWTECYLGPEAAADGAKSASYDIKNGVSVQGVPKYA